MTIDTIIKEMRRRLGEAMVNVGLDDTPEFPTVLLADHLAGAAAYLDALGIGTVAYTVTVSATPAISPEPSNLDGLLLAAKAAADLLAGDTASKVRSGELGVRFKTGVDEISTVEAARKVADEAKGLYGWFDQIKTFKLSSRTDGGRRIQ